jgi:hypothetical protein
LSSLFLCFLPLAYIFIGDSRKLIDRNSTTDPRNAKPKDEEGSEEPALNKSTVDTIVAAKTETIVIVVPDSTLTMSTTAATEAK